MQKKRLVTLPPPSEFLHDEIGLEFEMYIYNKMWPGSFGINYHYGNITVHITRLTEYYTIWTRYNAQSEYMIIRAYKVTVYELNSVYLRETWHHNVWLIDLY